LGSLCRPVDAIKALDASLRRDSIGYSALRCDKQPDRSFGTRSGLGVGRCFRRVGSPRHERCAWRDLNEPSDAFPDQFYSWDDCWPL